MKSKEKNINTSVDGGNLFSRYDGKKHVVVAVAEDIKNLPEGQKKKFGFDKIEAKLAEEKKVAAIKADLEQKKVADAKAVADDKALADAKAKEATGNK